MIHQQIGTVINTSSIYQTPPWGFEAEQDFLNQVVVIQTVQSPEALIKTILSIEKQLGRIRQGNHYHSRTMDIDILFYNNQIIEQPDLIIPHPRIRERKFVLIPLCEIAPELRHPRFNLTISELLSQCADPSVCVKIE